MLDGAGIRLFAIRRRCRPDPAIILSPVGIKGTLETLYVDADLRVDQGTQEDLLDASGAVAVPGYGPKLFILDRVALPVK